MNLEQIVGNETAQQIAKTLASRERISHETDVERFKTVLVREGFKVVPEDFDKFFKDMESLGLGSLIYGRGKNPTRFRWYYSLKDVGYAAMNPGSHIEPKKLAEGVSERVTETKENEPMASRKRPGRPKGSKNKLRKAYTRRVSDKTHTAVTRPGLVVMLSTTKGDMIPVNFEDLDLINKQIQTLRSSLG
jgi:hypothetical protein